MDKGSSPPPPSSLLSPHPSQERGEKEEEEKEGEGGNDMGVLAGLRGAGNHVDEEKEEEFEKLFAKFSQMKGAVYTIIPGPSRWTEMSLFSVMCNI